MTEPVPAERYDFIDEAWDDFVAIVELMDERRPGSGQDAGFDILDLIETRILPSPRTPVRHWREPGLHVYRIKRYWVRVIYAIDNNEVRIVAVEHMRELPDKWRRRLLQRDPDEG